MESIILQGLTVDEFRCIIREEVEKQKSEPMKDELLTRKEAAAFLKIHINTLNQWKDSGKIKAKGMGNRVYFSKNELLNSLEYLK